MRILATIVLLLITLFPAWAKDWSAMSGRERRLHVTAYVEANNFQCKTPPDIRSHRDAELKLMFVPSWTLVKTFIPRFCKKGPPKTQVVKAKPADAPVGSIPANPDVEEVKPDVHPASAGIAAHEEMKKP